MTGRGPKVAGNGIAGVRKDPAPYTADTLRLAQAIQSLPARNRAHLQAVADALLKSAPWDGEVEAEDDPMTTVTFDTLKYAEALKTAGVPDAQAKAQAEALADALREGGQHLATKADIESLRREMAELKADLKADVAKLQTDIGWIKWIITGGVGLYVLRSIVEWLR